MKQFIYTLLFFSTIFSVQAQTENAWVYFADKPNAAYFYSNPLEMISQRALKRRQIQNISPDIKDVPIYSDYINQIQNIPGISTLAKSKWLNCLHVQGTFEDIEALKNFTFVDSIDFANKSLNKKIAQSKSYSKIQDKLEVTVDFNYGNASNQIQMIHGDFLHQSNFTGTGMQVAVIDAGFINTNTMGAFSRIRTNNQILGTYNFISNSTDVYLNSSHGTMVLSTMAGYIENQYVGTAPDASYYLFITEDVTKEHPYEESMWVEAAEKADSLGVDVLTTSLAYSEFDIHEYNYSYADMDGETTFISRGAAVAFSRGMLVVNSAGNSGSGAWHYIGAPADVPSVLSIGAVDANGIIASFSSWGPNANNILKPDVCTQGKAAVVVNTSNLISAVNGTSFSAPILAGSATCLWQAFPNKTNFEIAEMIRESAHLYENPTIDYQYGYGIPDFEMAYTGLKLSELEFENIKIFPNPISNNELLKIFISDLDSNTNLKIIDLNGKTLQQTQLSSKVNFLILNPISKGIYIVRIQNEKENYNQKIIVN
jgi:subtilisin family serine protease